MVQFLAISTGLSFVLGFGLGVVSASLTVAGFVRDTRRKPRILASYFQEGGNTPFEPFYEGISLVVVGRKREIQVQEIGFLVKFGALGRRQEVRLATGATGVAVPHTLKDGHTLQGSYELGALIDDIYRACRGDDELRLGSTIRGYVEGAGTTYKGRRVWTWKDRLTVVWLSLKRWLPNCRRAAA